MERQQERIFPFVLSDEALLFRGPEFRVQRCNGSVGHALKLLLNVIFTIPSVARWLEPGLGQEVREHSSDCGLAREQWWEPIFPRTVCGVALRQDEGETPVLECDDPVLQPFNFFLPMTLRIKVR